MWDKRYAEPGFAYGEAPNGFVQECVALVEGPVLCVASGEGRNAVWLAEQGFEVHAVDGSQVGVDKTLALAKARGVEVHATCADLAEFDLGTDWGTIVIIFGHLPRPLRERVHASVVGALRPGGVLLLEAYTPRQLAHGTGGPPVAGALYEPDDLRDELAGLQFERLVEVERAVIEGKYHVGTAAVVQIIARRPADG